MQLEALECGAAALTMVLAYFGKWVPIEEVRASCGVSRDGAKAGNIARAARTYGLEAQGYKCEVGTLRDDTTYPCVIHWNFNHFVVLCGFKGNKAVINDPARGVVTVSEEELDNSFTGIIIQFEPSETFVPEGKQRSILSYAKKRLKGSGKAVAFVIFTTIVTGVYGYINPTLSRIFLDNILPGQASDFIVPFFIGMAVAALIQIVVAWIQAIYSLKIFGKMDIENSSAYIWQVLRMPIDFFSQRMTGDVQGRMLSNTAIANTLVNTAAPLFINTFMMIFYLVMMLKYNALLSLVGIVCIAINVGVANIISKKRINITRVQMMNSAKLDSTTVSGIKMIETIKSAGAENGFFEKWSGYQAGVNTQQIEYLKIDNYLGLIPQIINALCSTIVTILGVALVIEGQFSVGMVMAFSGILSSFMGPVGIMIKSGQDLQEMRTKMERVEDVMEYPRAVECDDTLLPEDKEYKKLLGKVELKNVSFGYCKLNEALIQDFNMSLEPGARVAFVGASGCGKSTLSKLISGLYEPWSGEILLDGRSIKDIDHNILTGSLAVVDQDITVFEDSIADNIKMWDDSISEERTVNAARDAHIHDDIMQRPGGYNYVVKEGGKDFSGGQRQRIEIARVLAQEPSVIIMDEATSALDARTEYEVVRDIKARGITCIIIAHRLSTIRDCDEIIVLESGKVVERGTHEELVKSGGKYLELISNE